MVATVILALYLAIIAAFYVGSIVLTLIREYYKNRKPKIKWGRDG